MSEMQFGTSRAFEINDPGDMFSGSASVAAGTPNIGEPGGGLGSASAPPGELPTKSGGCGGSCGCGGKCGGSCGGKCGERDMWLPIANPEMPPTPLPDEDDFYASWIPSSIPCKCCLGGKTFPQPCTARRHVKFCDKCLDGTPQKPEGAEGGCCKCQDGKTTRAKDGCRCPPGSGGNPRGVKMTPSAPYCPTGYTTGAGGSGGGMWGIRDDVSVVPPYVGALPQGTQPCCCCPEDIRIRHFSTWLHRIRRGFCQTERLNIDLYMQLTGAPPRKTCGYRWSELPINVPISVFPGLDREWGDIMNQEPGMEIANTGTVSKYKEAIAQFLEFRDSQKCDGVTRKAKLYDDAAMLAMCASGTS